MMPATMLASSIPPRPMEDDAATDENSTEPRTPEFQPGTAERPDVKTETEQEEQTESAQPSADTDNIARRTRSRTAATRRVGKQETEKTDDQEEQQDEQQEDCEACVESQQDVTVADGNVHLRVGLKRVEATKPWPHWAVRLADGDGFSLEIDTVNEQGDSQLASIMNQPAAPSYFALAKSEQDLATAGVLQYDQTQPGGQQLTLASPEPLNAFAAYQAQGGPIGRLAVQPAPKWPQPGEVVDPTGAGMEDWSSPMKRHRASTMDPWRQSASSAADGNQQTAQNTWNSPEAAGQEGEDASVAANNSLVAAAAAVAQQQQLGAADLLNSSQQQAAQQAAAAQQMFAMSGYLPMQQPGRGGAGSMMPAYMQYPQLIHPTYGNPMVNPFALPQRGLVMPGMPGDRLGGKRRSKHGLDDGLYENSEERSFNEAEKKKLREAPWPDKKRPTGLPTLYCHLCYLKEGVFRVVSAISPNPETVYFRHQQCHTSFKRGEDLPKRIVAQYQAWYKKRGLAQQANRAEMGGYGRGSNIKIGSPDLSPTDPDRND